MTRGPRDLQKGRTSEGLVKGQKKDGLHSERGFTLIELLVTVTIMGVLAAVVSIGVGGGTSNAVTKSHQGIFNQVQAGVDSYVATSTTNVLTRTACDVTNCVTTTVAASMTGFYTSDGSTVPTFVAGYAYKVFSSADTEVVAGGFLRLNATSSG